ncbi:MAG TPA: hypothetical protein VMV44_08480 [Rectinemataceae bacterium]|nr:hypothetical protein [Rectinemataceae bacterium]
MELLTEELDKLIDKLEQSRDFRNDLDSVKSVYPFSRYEYVISTLLSKGTLSYEEYLDLRDSYINRNLFLYVFEISAPRGFGDTWAFSHLLSVEPELRRPSKKIDMSYKGEYDLYLPYFTRNIKIEVKASRAVDRDKPDEPLYVKALSSHVSKKFLMNFQQLKPSCCDVFLWIAVYRDCVKYWVLKNQVIRNHPDFTPQHRNESTAEREAGYDRSRIYEGQIMITNDNIATIKDYLVEGRAIRQAIIEEFEK